MTDHVELILDGTKIAWHQDRIDAWERGERIAPITIDMSLTRACNFACHFCYAMLQENERKVIDKKAIFEFLEDCAEIGVKGISLVSDGESTNSPVFVDACKRYAEIMGVKEHWFDRVAENIKAMGEIKREQNLGVTIGMQMVLMPEYHDQIMPLAQLGKELRPDYLVIKHCSDDEDGSLGVDYSGYADLYETLHAAEALSDDTYQVTVKWSKIDTEGTRSYQRCYGAPFMLQMSGSGLVAPCGMLFNERYKKFHIGNITEERFRDIFYSDRYWEVMNYLASPDFNAQKMCGSLCLQHKVNEFLDGYQKGDFDLPEMKGEQPMHINFI